MSLSRRDALKLGGLAAVGAAGLADAVGQHGQRATPSLLPTSKMPKPYAAAFGRLEVLPPAATEMDDEGPVAVYDITAKAGAVRIVPGMLTPVLGYNGAVPAQRIDVEQGTRIEMTMRNKLPTAHPTFGTPMAISTHLHGSASLPQYDGYASDVTAPGQKKTTSTRTASRPARSGTTTTACTTPRRTPTPAWRRSTTCTTRWSAACSRRACSTCRSPSVGHHVRRRTARIVRRPQPFRAVGRRHPGQRPALAGDEGQERIYRFRFLNASLSRSYRPTSRRPRRRCTWSPPTAG